MQRYWLANGDSETQGPFEVAELQAMAAAGRINRLAEVCSEGGSQWRGAHSFLESIAGAPEVPPPSTAPSAAPLPEPVSPAPIAGTPKSRITAGILALFLGGFGVHNFYLGFTSRGLCQLILCLTFIGAPVAGIWALIDAIQIFAGSTNKDASGQPLT